MQILPRRGVALAAVVALSITGCTKHGSTTSFVPLRVQAATSFTAVKSQAVRTLARTYKKPKAAVQRVPMSLTASDGSGLRLVSLTSKAVVQGPLAFTELHLVFHNPQDRVREGRFTIALPPGAAVSRFAMKLPAGWQEAEVVERQAARRIYEDFLHRRQDPALLEKKAGNEFRARIFPIPARADKEIIISYSQELAARDGRYRLYLRGLPKIDKLDITAFVGSQRDGSAAASSLGGVALSHKVVRVSKTSFTPRRDFEVRSQSTIQGLRHENLALARVVPEISAKRAPMAALMILVDTSASRAAGFAAQVEQLGALVHHLKSTYGAAVRLQVACFDQQVSSVFDGPIGDFGRKQLDAMRARRPLGASNLARALAAVGNARGYTRLVLVTDGIATAGETKAAALRAAVRKLREHVQRLDVVLVGGIRDESTMRKLVTGTLTRDGLVIDGTLSAATIATRLAQRTLSGITVSVPGAKWVWPERIDGARPGQQVLVFADLGEGAAKAKDPLVVKLGGPLSQSARVRLASVKRPLLQRAWVAARIARLSQQRDAAKTSPDVKAAIGKQIIALSIKHRVLCDATALLVLESEADYRRYNIERTALSNILVVGASGVEVKQRTAPPVVAPMPPPRPKVDMKRLQKTKGARRVDPTAAQPPPPPQTEGALDGRLGGRVAGPGRASAAAPARIAAPSPEPAARLRARKPMKRRPTAAKAKTPRAALGVHLSLGHLTIEGRIDRAATLRQLRRRQVCTRACFQRALRRDASLAGKLVLRLTIDRSGHTTRVDVTRDTVGDRAATQCIKACLRSARFPKPTGGPAKVTVQLAMRAASASLHRAPPRPASLHAAAPAQPPLVRESAANEPEPRGPAPLKGKLAAVMSKIHAGFADAALLAALEWRASQPGNVLALVALGQALEAKGHRALAARAYGSIIDLFPSRADMRRFAGARLDALGELGLTLAADTYRQAATQRPDHASGHRGLAYALLRLGRYDQAFAALEAGLNKQNLFRSRPGVLRILREDIGLVAAALLHKRPERRDAIEKRLRKVGAAVAQGPSLRFVLTWETDSNDVDFHIRDAADGHAFYKSKHLPSGGDLYADVTNGYGPECFTIFGKPTAFPYRLQIHYYRRGPMGYGMGKLQIIQHDGSGVLHFEDRPFVVMADRAYVDLGVVKGPLQ